MSEIIRAVPQGTVLFSTITAPDLACFAMVLVAASSAPRSALAPAPIPYILVGVLTQMKTMSASAIQAVTLHEKNRLGFLAGKWIVVDSSPGRVTAAVFVPSRAARTILGRPVSWIGRWLEFHAAIRSVFKSTTLTVMSGLW